MLSVASPRTIVAPFAGRSRARVRTAIVAALSVVLMKSLCRTEPFAIESLPLPALRRDPVKEGIMLDFIFVALGVTLIAAMGLYAAGLRRL